nr:hypothetical protein [Tanacetum cinerariifolium]
MFAALATWALGAGMRRHFEDRQLTADCCIFGVFAAWLARSQLTELLHQNSHASGAPALSSMAVLALFAGPLAVLGLRLHS